MSAALRVEALKLTRSPVGAVATAAIVLGTLVLLGSLSAAVADGNDEVIDRIGPMASLDWAGLQAGAVQIVGAGGLLGAGIVLAWMFGREFADGTITGLFGLPVGLARIALAKLVVFAAWVVLVGVLLVFGLLAVGLVRGYGPPTAGDAAGLARIGVLTLLTGALAVPVAWLATVARSVLSGVAGAIGLVIVGQVGALTAAGAWIPFAAPSLWAMGVGAVSTPRLALPLIVSAAFSVLVSWSWSRLQLDR